MRDHPHDHTDHTPEAPNPRRAMLAGLGGLAAGALLSSGRTAHAGPLTPPAGPIEPTMKRLDEVEPRRPINALPGSSNSVHRILLPGSYYLTGDIVGEPGKSGIQVISLAGEVVIDLNGFTIRGVDGSIVGISCNGTSPRVVIRNGQIRGWGWNGVRAACPIVLEDLRIEGNGQGEATHGGARGGDAVAAQVRRCVFAGNIGDGLFVGEGSTVEQCTASDNSRDGISTTNGCSISNCSAAYNATSGFRVPNGGSLVNCIASNSPLGFLVGFGSVVANCSASICLNGINVDGEGNLITGNLCVDNVKGSGIFIFGRSNKIDSNTCRGNGTGIVCMDRWNFFSRNTCIRNARNWLIEPLNACLVIDATLNQSIINGNSGGISPGSTDPNANFSI